MAEKTAPSCQKSAFCLFPVSPPFCRTSGSLSYLPRRTKIDADRAHLESIWALLGSPGLSWGPLGRRSGTPVRFPGLPWALLASLGFPGLPWVPLVVPGGSIWDSPGLPWASLGSPGAAGLDLGLLGSIWDSWARSGAPGHDLSSWARSGAPGLDLRLLSSICGSWARSGAPGFDLELLRSIWSS
jgi:hypothetical protein